MIKAVFYVQRWFIRVVFQPFYTLSTAGRVIGTKLYPKSVGASVDKVFVLVCSPMKLSSTEIWLKNIQAL
ncbi:hypothetical protein CCL14_26600 [Pseudomonas syringae]|nr:hypothetical protein CCL14_26600 [Pseudomonas syringae]